MLSEQKQENKNFICLVLFFLKKKKTFVFLGCCPNERVRHVNTTAYYREFQVRTFAVAASSSSHLVPCTAAGCWLLAAATVLRYTLVPPLQRGVAEWSLPFLARCPLQKQRPARRPKYYSYLRTCTHTYCFRTQAPIPTSQLHIQFRPPRLPIHSDIASPIHTFWHHGGRCPRH